MDKDSEVKEVLKVLRQSYSDVNLDSGLRNAAGIEGQT
jgi:hypothetical protein